ncbi:hypothetical protein Tco_1337712 [Tanacetum coccineum]
MTDSDRQELEFCRAFTIMQMLIMLHCYGKIFNTRLITINLKSKDVRSCPIPAQLEIKTQKAIKASRRESRFQHQTGGSIEGAALRPEVLDEIKGKSADSNEGASTLLEVSDELEDKSKAKDDLNDWGSTDDEEYLHAYKDEKPKDIPWQSTDDEESKNDDEKGKSDEDKSIDIEMSDDEMTDTDDEDTVMGKAEKIVEKKADEEHEADEEQKGDKHDEDEQVVVTVSTTKSTSSHSVSSNIGNQFINSPNASLINTILENAKADSIPFPDTEVVKSVVKRFIELERAIKELKQADHSTAILASTRSQVPSVDLSEKRDYKDIIKESVQANVINKVKNFLPKFLPQTVTQALEKTLPSLGQSSSKVLKNKDRGDDQDKDVLAGSNQGKKTKKGRGNESESSKNTSTTKESSKGKSPARTSKYGKFVTAKELFEEPVFEIALNDVEKTVDDKVGDVGQPPHNDAD